MAPFYVGQTVIALVDYDVIKKGQELVVKSVLPCLCSCGGYLLTFGIAVRATNQFCPVCGYRYTAPQDRNFKAYNFAPKTFTFESISFSKIMEEQLISQN